MSSQTTTARPPRSSAIAVVVGIITAAAFSIALNAGVAAIALAAGASSDFVPLTPQAYGMWSVVGVLAGFAGWAVVRARSSRPRRLMRLLVPTVVSTSWTPDVLLVVNDWLPGAGWGAAIALMAMHVVVAAVVVVICLRVLPLPTDRR
ncbi:DUF6069 family protein [Lentzea sp. JNUCC 0626]|uniref:DUF6069 family protein n=1 Tax=Lentzea sp. JNUCC 0626 TaxID=3367513 RepID=UPI00374A8FBF